MFPENLDGTIERITYYSGDTGYCVLRLRPDKRSTTRNTDEEGLVTVVGVMPELQPGETLKMSGQWMNHNEYGKQFKAQVVTQVAPTTVEGIKRYLGSGLIKGVGHADCRADCRFFRRGNAHDTGSAPGSAARCARRQRCGGGSHHEGVGGTARH